MTARKPPAHLRAAETRARNRPPLPRAVRELLRDVVLLASGVALDAQLWLLKDKAAKLLGTTPAAIVARARKVRK